MRRLAASASNAADVPRDHYALFSMGATNYVTIIENDSTHELMNVSPGDPIQMHVIKVVPDGKLHLTVHDILHGVVAFNTVI